MAPAAAEIRAGLTRRRRVCLETHTGRNRPGKTAMAAKPRAVDAGRTWDRRPRTWMRVSILENGRSMVSHKQRVGLMQISMALALGACLAGCAAVGPTPEPLAATPGSPGVPFIPTLTPGPAAPQELTLWVSEEFSPDADSPAARRFAARLASFEAQHPGLTLEVRVKAHSGLAGLAEGLLAAGAAAPAALPDLALLDPAGLEATASNGLLAPLEGHLALPSVPDWTEAASQAARVNGVFFGLPFASEADGLAYRKDGFVTPPTVWDDLLRGPAPFVFPAADPAALFSLAQYEALGGRLIDSARHPALDPFPLAQVLAFEDALHAAGRLPLAASQLTTTSETWAAVRDARAVSGLAAFRAFAREADTAQLALVPVPTRDGPGTVYAHTWNWALLGRTTGTQSLAIEFLLWMTDPEFLGPYTRESGFLPPTHAALDLWPPDPLKDSAADLLSLAHAAPSTALQQVLGPLVSEAALTVLTGNLDADAAAQAAAAAVSPTP